jgi:thiol-disulfide isomerase/thioredoxin
MKKTLLLAMLGLAGLTANAQLANGSTAPDFTATDINGNTHTLSEYLAAGKTVIIDVSATWCGPCWNYHGTHALADLHNAYGPNGSNEVVVLFVEGDPGTSVESIYGTNTASDQSTTQGNWTIGSPYPIIDSGEIGDLYQIAYFPTVYRICPSGIVTLVDQQTIAQLKSGISSGCGQLTGATNHAGVEAHDVRVCETTGNVSTDIKNYGQNALTGATVVLKNGATVIATEQYTGNLAQFASGSVDFDGVTFTPGATYTAEITGVNGGNPYSASLTSDNFGVTLADQSNNNIFVNVYTDNYPSEISWKIKNSNGTVVASGGPYQAGTGDQWGAGGPDANTTKTHEVTLPEGIDCYTIEMLDGFDDGWSLGNTFHGIEIFDASGSVAAFEAGNFGGLKSIGSAFKSSGALGNETFATDAFSIYPNPSNGVFNFATQETVSVVVTDLTGKTVFTAANINNGGTMDLSVLQTGMYIAKVKGASSERIEKLVIK